MPVEFRILLVLSLLYPVTGFAQDTDADPEALYEQAKAAIRWEFDSDWSFVETSLEEGELRIARYDPRKPPAERWTLLSIDGRAAGPDDVEEFRNEKAEDQGGNAFAEVSRELDERVTPGSLRLIETTADRQVLGFVPAEDDEDIAGHVDGRMVIARSGPYLESMEIRNTRVVDAGLGTRIEEFLRRYRFEPVAAGGPVFPKSTELRVKGTALWLIDFDEVEVIRLSDFQPVGERDTGDN